MFLTEDQNKIGHEIFQFFKNKNGTPSTIEEITKAVQFNKQDVEYVCGIFDKREILYKASYTKYPFGSTPVTDNKYLLSEKKGINKSYELLLRGEKKEDLIKRRQDWLKKNWLIADVIKLTIGAVIGFAITLITILLTDNHNKHQESKKQYPSTFQDTLNKKKIH